MRPDPTSTLAGIPGLTALVELYEYKVADLGRGREPSGGLRSVRELRRTLLTAELPRPLQRRLVGADRLYLRWKESASPDPAPTRPGVWQAPSTTNDEEAQAWHELQRLMWHADLMAEMDTATQDLRLEAGRPTLRVLYAVTENAERAERGLPVPFAVPPVHDPLVSLDDSEVVRQLTRTLGDMLLLPAGQQRVQQALAQVHANPFPRHPDEDVLLAQLSAVERGHWSDHEREVLKAALRAQLGLRAEFNRDPRERPELRAAARRIQHWLGPRLDRQPRLLTGAVPAHSILYAQEAAGALSAPPEDRDLLCLYLGSPQRLAHWRGLKLSWRSMGPNWQLLVQDAEGEPEGKEPGGKSTGQVALLRPDLPASERHARVQVGGRRLQLFFCGDYVLLRLQEDPRSLERLAWLAAQGRAAALLLDPAEDYGYLRLGRALAQRLRGGPMHAASSRAPRYAALTPPERLQSARRTLETLGPLLRRVGPAGTAEAAHAAQNALHLPTHYGATLHQAVHQATFVPETLSAPQAPATPSTFLNANGLFGTFRTDAGVLELRLPGDRILTLLRDYRDELVALLPGQVSASVSDVQVLRLHDLTVVLAQHGPLLAVGVLPMTGGPVA